MNDVIYVAAARLPRGSVPAYQQLANALRESIIRDDNPVGKLVPKEREVAELFAVSLVTVRQALQILEGEGLIRKRRGKCAEVISKTRVPPVLERRLLLLDRLELEPDRRTEIIELVDSEVSSKFFGEEGDRLLHVKKLRTRYIWRDSVIGHGESVFHPSVCGQIRLDDFGGEFIFRTVSRLTGVVVRGATVTVRSEIANGSDVGLLNCDEGASILEVLYRYETLDGVTIQVTTNRFLGSVYKLTYEI